MNKRNFLITAALSAALCFFGTANAAETLKIGASPVPHADILKVVQPELAKKGIDLKIIEFSDLFSRTWRFLTKIWMPTSSSICLI